jgi:hypothetical protein
MPSRIGQDKVAEAGVRILARLSAGSDDFLDAGAFAVPVSVLGRTAFVTSQLWFAASIAISHGGLFHLSGSTGVICCQRSFAALTNADNRGWVWIVL